MVWPILRFKCLLQPPHFSHQLSKPYISSQRIDYEVSVQALQKYIPFAIRGVKPDKGVIVVSRVGIELGDKIRREVPGLALRLTDFNAFGERSPASQSLVGGCRCYRSAGDVGV